MSVDTVGGVGVERQASRFEDVAGRDAALPSWAAGGTPERPAFDSAVVCGNGIGASIFAARLARSAAFEGRVVIAAPPVEESRRLVGGLTLRSRSLDYYAAALGSTRKRLLDVLFPNGAEPAMTTHQMGSVFDPIPGKVGDVQGAVRAANAKEWMSAAELGAHALAYGLRNSHLAARLAELTRELPIEFHEQPIDSLEAARALAPGSNPLIVNATIKPLLGSPAQLTSPKPRAMVVASQLPFSAPRRRECGVLGDGASLMSVVHREGRNDMGVFNPIVDSLSPTAEYYGVVFRLLRPDPAPDKAREQLMVREQLLRIADAVGLEPVDAEETEGRAMLPCLGWKDLRRLEGGVLELNRLYHAGNPIITGDGMAKAGLAGLICAEAVVAGEDPVRAANDALHMWRTGNQRLAVGLTSMARVANAAIRLSPRRVLATGANTPDMWAGIAGVA